MFCVIGNFAILLLLLFIGKCLFKKERCLFKYIITTSFLLNFFVFLIGYFTRNFKAMLSFHNLTLFRNPDAGYAIQIVVDGLGEMFGGWELLCFIPFIVLLLFYLLIRRKVREVKHYRIRFLFIFVKRCKKEVLFSYTVWIFYFFNYRFNECIWFIITFYFYM